MSKPIETPFHLLIAAAGSGSRTGLSTPKQYAKIGGKAVLRHTIEKFIKIQGVKSIQVIIDPEHQSLYMDAVEGLTLAPPIHGGKTRKQSIFNGLQNFSKKLDEDIILIHDAARPFISEGAVTELLAAMTSNNAATLVAPIPDTIVDADYTTYDRDKIAAVQTPQAFRIGDLKSAHEQFKDDDRFTDDAGLLAASGKKVAQVIGSRSNFKITTSEDMIMAEKLFASATETRTGFGYDVHAFDPAPATHVRLGGVDIPHDKKLLGHSDADVILHALTDALLGTIGDGDIGQLFPPSDKQWKNADSEIFVSEAVRRVIAHGGKILHADITLIAETPKIGPHRDKMIARIATMLGLTPNRIGLKATTSEGLGFTGRKEGMVAQAVVTITLPSDIA